MKDYPIQHITRMLATLRERSVFLLEIGPKPNKEVFAEMHATLRNDQLPPRVLIEALAKCLEEAAKDYREQLAKIPERSGNEDEPANPT